MRIGLDGIPLVAPKTGVGHYTFELGHSLAHALPNSNIEFLSPVPYSSLTASEEKDAPANLSITCTHATGPRRFWWSVGLPLHLRQSGIELFHGTNYEVPLWSKCRTVLTIHDLSLLLYSETHERSRVRRARLRLSLMARSAEMIITATRFIKKEVSEHLKVASSKIAVTPYAPRRVFRPVAKERCDEVRARLGVEDCFILYVGTIEPRKNLVTLVRAFDEILRRTTLRRQLVITGAQGWLSDDLYRLIEQLKINDKVLFTGYVTDEDLSALYSSCRCFVYPSLYEGFGLPPLEAMACGAPVVTSSAGSIAETVGRAARIISPTDAQALAKEIVELVEDEGARSQLSKEGLARAADYTWERTARETIEVYEEALRRKAGRLS